MTATSLVIEAEPVPASRPKVTARGTFYPKRHMEYAGFLRECLNIIPAIEFDGPVEVQALFVMPRYKTSDALVHKADLDNLAKLPLDCMTKCKAEDETPRFWKDDSLIVKLTTMKRFAREGEKPHTKIKVIPVQGSVEDHIEKAFADE